MQPDPDQLRRILLAGLRAPSAENKHYLRFQACSDSVQLLATDCASWAERPHRQMLALLSYGAVIENMALRSAQLGHALSALMLPDRGRPDLIADLRWTPTAALPDPLCDAIEARHTNRRFYRRTRLPAQALTAMAAAAEAIPGARLLWLDDRISRPRALQAIRIAETERFRRRELHRELFGAVRFELGWQRTADECLAPAALEVEPPMRLPFALLRHWPLMRAAGWFGAHLALGLRAGYLPCALAPHIGLLLAGAHDEVLATLHAGRAFERLWLQAAADGLALQPMASATALLHQRPGNGWVDAEVRSRLEQLLQALCRGIDGQPFVLFRVGHAEAPSVVGGRRPLEHYFD
jgi:hypothetical protein